MDTPEIINLGGEPVTTAPPEPAPKSKKIRRSRHAPEPDWSAMVRRRVKSNQRRVGQACDRCKKMKCSPDPGGCASCRSLNIPCKVTDLVTGETMARGEARKMREDIRRLQEQKADLECQIVQLQQKNTELQERLDGPYRTGLMDPYEPELDPGRPHLDLL
ncbi:hypothetical protein N7457_009200 [Penicillium paradoxum]|uniref:uncharacterized protein n=1 Tax=Penicillium paradoxum TaxID=176176 RepID=UPI0025489E16|nr:uncharacterized protein N7457_009200 [Penicillium paradoxum]KAJ5774304.1 hypothetical protein N7457_009200 [Penicillium paradoxum]